MSMPRYFEQEHVVCQPGPGDIPEVIINNRHGSARISLQGASVIDWAPAGKAPVIWLSTDARFAPGKSIRGGVPVCWPWFGAHASEADYPAHGIARTRQWVVTGCDTDEAEVTTVSFELPLDRSDPMWPHACSLEYAVSLGEQLQLVLTTTNTGDQTFEISQALHTYFNIGDISDIEITGLEDKAYLDKTDGMQQKQQQGVIRFAGEVDRVYLDTADTCTINDSNLDRKIIIDKQNSFSTVVWNPWEAIASKMGDLGENSYRGMVCVETANAGPDSVAVEPGESISLLARYDCV